MTAQEREKALALLTRSRQTLRNAVEGTKDDEARWKPSPERWSVLEYVEHLAVSDDGLVDMIKRMMTEPATPESAEARVEREQKIRNAVMPRGANQAPHPLRPHGKFMTLDEAMQAFEDARDRTMEFARTVEGDLRSHFSNHSVLGPLDAYQWLIGNARHAETHASHIQDIRLLFASLI